MKTSRNALCWITAGVLALSALSLTAETRTLLGVGDRVPLFTGKDQDGHRWKLADHLGRHFVLVYFYPVDGTTGSIEEACSFRDNLTLLKQEGVTVVGVSFDRRKTQQDFSFKYGINFPLLADKCGNIADAYGVRVGEDLKLDRRVSFLIGLDGRIVHITDSPNPNVHMREMAEAIARLSERASL
jgi:thioredoxin-dependent peroxiredoxin